MTTQNREFLTIGLTLLCIFGASVLFAVLPESAAIPSWAAALIGAMIAAIGGAFLFLKPAAKSPNDTGRP